MTTRWITTLDAFAALAPAWDEALAAAQRAGSAWGFDNPFLLSDFLLAWCEAFVPPDQLRVWTCWEGGELTGGLPLYLTRRRHGWTPNSRLGWWWSALYPVGLHFTGMTEPFWRAGPGALSPALAAGLRELPGWSYLMLPRVRRPLLGGDRARWSRLRQMAPVTATGAQLALEGIPDAAAYLATRRPKLRENLRRRLRQAGRMGGAALTQETGRAEVEALIDFQLRYNGPFRYEPEQEVGASPARWAAFIRAMLLRLFERGRLDAMALRLGGRLAAAGFGIRCGAGHKSMLISYDPAFHRLGPGFLYLYRLIDWCVEKGDPYIDVYGNGDAEWKQSWCNRFPAQHTVGVFNRGLAGSAMYWGGRLYLR